MPYNTVKDLPENIKKYSPKLQRQWMHVFNTIYESANDEGRAFKGANSVLKKRFKDGQNRSKESHSDYFSSLVDSWLGNLNG